jgi:monomeric sarcosine oxidase
MSTYDVIVLGTGGIGSAALYQLARRGVRAIGVDRFHPPHDRGSSHGQTRVIRQAYFEHPSYVPLLLDSYRRWHELEQTTGRHLYDEIGLVEIGPPDGIVVPGVLRAASEHGLEVEQLTAAEVTESWSGLQVPSLLAAVFERRAGYLLVEDCVRAHLAAAQAAGAELLTDTPVRNWSATDCDVRVQTDRGELQAGRLIVTAGAWATTLLHGLSVQLEVRRKSLFWFHAESPEYEVASGLPVFLFELPAGVFYGFPKLDEQGVKVAEHSGGCVVNDPLDLDRSVDMIEQQRVTDFLTAHLPNVSHRVVEHAVCLYTMSPDEHFIVDRHPVHANVTFAAGLSGHGFKFAPVLGAALADLSLAGTTNLPVEFLSLSRFAH